MRSANSGTGLAALVRGRARIDSQGVPHARDQVGLDHGSAAGAVVARFGGAAGESVRARGGLADPP